MSLYVEWINQIKAKATHEWLTDGQRAAYDSIVGRWLSHRFVCLCGPAGSGKSFVARLLAREQGYTYVNDLRESPAGVERVVVDGAEYSRLMRPLASALGLKRVVVLARTPPRDPMPIAKIILAERDVGQFQRNLTRNGILQSFQAVAEGTDLGQILRAEAVQRSGIHVDQRS